MKTLFNFLAFLMLATVAQATDVTFSFSDFTTGTSYFSATNIVLRVKMLSAITVNGTSVVLKDWINYTNSAQGTLTISNMVPGVYSCTLTAKNTESPFQITVTNSATAISASSIITTATNVVSGTGQAYPTAVSDALYLRKSNDTVLNLRGTVSNITSLGAMVFRDTLGASNYIFQAGNSLIFSNAFRNTNTLLFNEDTPSWFFYEPVFSYSSFTLGPGAQFVGNGGGLTNLTGTG
jgi:hypothetical protein